MRVELRDVSKGLALPPTSVSYASGEVAVTVAETEQRPTVLGLIASGRMRPAGGEVLLDGKTDASALRRRVALVDAPDVSDPAPNVTVAGVAAEELMFAGRTANPIAVRRWLDAAGYGSLARVPFGDVSPRERLGLLLELTALRDGIEGIVLVSPDRHGGDPRETIDLVQRLADRGLAMLVIVGQAAAALLSIPVAVGANADESAAVASAPVPAADEDLDEAAGDARDSTARTMDSPELPSDDDRDHRARSQSESAREREEPRDSAGEAGDGGTETENGRGDDLSEAGGDASTGPGTGDGSGTGDAPGTGDGPGTGGAPGITEDDTEAEGRA